MTKGHRQLTIWMERTGGFRTAKRMVNNADWMRNECERLAKAGRKVYIVEKDGNIAIFDEKHHN